MKRASELNASALLLAGGAGSRIGGNKLFLARDGVPMIAGLLGRLAPLFARTLLCIGQGETERVRRLMSPLLSLYNVVLVEDRVAGRGPLEGLYRGLCAMETEWGFLLGCDMPTPQEAVIRHIWSQAPDDAQASVVYFDGRPMALHAFYRKSCISRVAREIASGRRTKRGGPKMTSFYDDIALHVVEERELSFLPGYLRSFDNYNTQAELRNVIGGT